MLVEQTEIEEKMTLFQYDPFDQEKIVVNEQIILEYYRSEGYPGVRVKSRVEAVESSLESEGKKFRVVFEMEENLVFISLIFTFLVLNFIQNLISKDSS